MYVHGYSSRETERLSDQASTLEELLHQDTSYPKGALVLEAGCGTGAQTTILTHNSPECKLISLDVSIASLNKAIRTVGQKEIDNVKFMAADVYRLPFPDDSFDHVFVCFVLEHLKEPIDALRELKRVLKPNGSITVIEGDHGSCYYHPESKLADAAWNCLIDVQSVLGGNSKIGRELYPLLYNSDFRHVKVSPRMVYCDENRPDLMDGFVKKTIIPMVEGVRDEAIQRELTDEGSFDEGISDLHKTGSPPNGTFCYTFFKGTATK